MSIVHLIKDYPDDKRKDDIQKIMSRPATFYIGANRIVHVPLNLFSVDTSYQRYNHMKATVLRKQFDVNKLMPLMVSYRDGEFIIIDGMHRHDGAKFNNQTSLPAVIMENLTQEDEARIFAEQNDCVVLLSPRDTYKANIVWGETTDMAIKSICDQYGLTVSATTKDILYPMTAITACRQIINDKNIAGSQCLTWTFDILRDTHWIDDRASTTDKTIRAFHRAYRNAVIDNDVAGYKKNLIDVLSCVNPATVSSFANVNEPHHEKRTAYGITLTKIGKGEYTLKHFTD